MLQQCIDNKRMAAHNNVLTKAGVTNFYETFPALAGQVVLYSTLVFKSIPRFRDADMPRLRQYPNR